MKIIKRGYRMPINDEILFTFDPNAPQREVAGVEVIPVTDRQRADHARAKALLEEMEANPYIGQGFEGELELRNLEPQRITHYAETYDEWLDRCRAWAAESTVGA